MTKLAMIITSTAQSGRRDQLFELYQEHLAPRAEANDNQEVVVWCDDAQDPDRFHLFEVYADTESFQANAGSEFFANYMAAAGPLLAAEPVVHMASPRWATGISV